MYQDDLQQGDNQQVQNTTTPAPEAAPAPQQEPIQPSDNAEVVQSTASNTPKEPITTVIPATPPVKTNQEERMWGAISYIAFLGIVTLAMNSKSAFCKKHAAQGLLLFGVWFIGLIMMAVPSNLVILIGIILFFGAMGLGGFGMYKAFTSYELNIPVLSDIAKKIPVDSIIGTVTGKVVEPSQSQQNPTTQKVANDGQSADQVVNSAPAQEQPVQSGETPPATVAPAQQEQKNPNQQ